MEEKLSGWGGEGIRVRTEHEPCKEVGFRGTVVFFHQSEVNPGLKPSV